MAQAPNRRRSSKLGTLTIALLILLGMGVAAGTIFLLGDVKLPWSKSVEAKTAQAEDHTGKVHVPVASRSIPAYNRIELSDFLDARTTEPTVRWVSAEAAKQNGWITEGKLLIGRVTAREKAPGYGFTESDLLPPGSPARPSAALPLNTHGMYISADKVQGLSGLLMGDVFDMVATRDVTADSAPGKDTTMSPAEERRESDERPWLASTRVLVQGAKIIEPVSQAKSTSGRHPEAFVAVPDRDYELLLQAIKRNAEIQALTRSSSPLAMAAPLPPPEKVQAADEVQVLRGSQTTTVKLPPSSTDGGTPR